MSERTPAGQGGHPLSTSLRSRSLAATLQRGRALAPRLGLVRCEDVTAADTLGLPVWISRRARGIVGTVHAGKGLLPAEAEAGALMEAIEIAVAEQAAIQAHLQPLPVADLLAQFGPGFTLADLAPRFEPAALPPLSLWADHAEAIGTGRRLWLPAELLHLVPPAAIAADRPLFGCSSNGLASGNTLDEASLHGLLEVLERDSIALDHLAPARCHIDLASLPAPLAAWPARWQRLGVQLQLRVLPNVAGLACVEARLDEPAAPARSGWLGYGCHLDAGVAVSQVPSSGRVSVRQST